jgi:hypothetical protein
LGKDGEGLRRIGRFKQEVGRIRRFKTGKWEEFGG